MLLDTILRGGRIITMDPARPRAHTIGFLNGRVVGLDDDLAGLEARAYLDVGGRCVIPGLIDAHCHTTWFGLSLIEPTVSSCACLDEVLRLLRTSASDRDEMAGSSARDWLVVSGFDHQRFGGQFPALRDLDAATGDRPLFMRHISGHLAVVNTAALRQTGVLDGNTAVPPGGYLARDHFGELTGVVEETAQGLFQDAFQPRPLSLLHAAVRAATEVYAQQGITSFTDAGVGAGWISQSPVEVAAFQQAAEEGTLLSRAQLMPTLEALTPLRAHPADGLGSGLSLGVRTGFGSELLSFGPVKVFLDGSLLAETAAVHEPYCSHGPGTADPIIGYFQQDPAQLRSAIEDAYRSGWAIAAHAIGDRAIDLALDILEDLQGRFGRRLCPNRIEHASLTRPDHLPRLAAAGIAVTPQASFFRDSGEAMTASLGPSRARWAYRAATFLTAEITVAGSSDRPVADGHALRGMQAFVDRKTAQGRVFGDPAECLTPWQALTAYTSGAAAATGLSRHKGSLKPGMLADVAVLSGDPLQNPDIGALSVEVTLLGGNVVHCSM